MNWLRKTTISKYILAFLMVGVLTLGLVSSITMNHEPDGRHGDCPIAAAVNCEKSAPQSNACIEYHIGIMEKLSAALPGQNVLDLFGLLLLAVTGIALFILTLHVGLQYERLRIKLRQLYEKTFAAFFAQLGFWLTIFEKRDPSYAFALA